MTRSRSTSPLSPSPTPSTLPLRWWVLFFSCCAMTGTYYSFDIPAALHQQLKDYMSNSENFINYNYSVMFNLLYSVYSIPNIILPLAGGAIVDSIGSHSATVLFASLTLLGQLVFAMGISSKSWTIMLVGRTIYGLGGESITVATSTLSTRWFGGEELALAFGINLAVSRLGSVLNNLISPTLANNSKSATGGGGGGGLRASIWFGVMMNALSVLSALVICYLTKVGEKELRRVEMERMEGPRPNELLTAALLEDDGLAAAQHREDGDRDSEVALGTREEEDRDQDQDQDKRIDLVTESQTEEEGIINSMDNDDLGQEGDEDEDSQAENENDGSANTVEHSPRLLEADSTSASLLQFTQTLTPMFWLLSASCVVVYGCILPFNNIASGILLERNYFTQPPKDCVLKYADRCTSGSLVDLDKGKGQEANPSTDAHGNACPNDPYNQPILPTSIHIHSSSSDDENNINIKWDHDTYDYDKLVSTDVDCNDAFWNEACTADYCAAQRRATERSGKVMSIPYILSATLSPFCGHVVDRIGCRAIIASLASIILVIVHLSLAWYPGSSPLIPLMGQGMAYVAYAAVIWPSVPLTIRQKQWTGTAFGAMTALQNVGLAVFPLIIAGIYTASDDSYIPSVEYFFVACAALGTCLGVLLNLLDGRYGSKLNMIHR